MKSKIDFHINGLKIVNINKLHYFMVSILVQLQHLNA